MGQMGGSLVQPWHWATGRLHSGKDALERAYNLIDALKARATSPLLGIGVGVPGVIDPTKGSSIHWAVNLSWLDLPIRALLKNRYHLPVYVANDSQAAVLAESFFGKWKNVNLIVLKVERGVSAGIFANGELWQGDGFGAGEIGHVTVVENGPRCHCGHFGLFGSSGGNGCDCPARTRRGHNPFRYPTNTGFQRDQTLTFEDVVWAAQQNDPRMNAIVSETGQYLGRAVANLVGAFNIHHIVVAGTVTALGEPLLRSLRETVLTHALGHLAEITQIEFSTLGEEIVILGASALLLNDELGLAYENHSE